MINPFKDVNWKPNRAARRTFAVSLMVGFPIVAVLFLLVGFFRAGTWAVAVPLRIGGMGLLAGAVLWMVPAIARPFYVAWYAVACSIGFVVSNVLLTTVYYVVVTGTGLVMRLAGRRLIEKAPDRRLSTYWIDAPPAPTPEQYLRQF